MNIETGQLMHLTDEQKALLDKMGTPLVAIDEKLRTEREKVTGQVLLSDTNQSPLAKQLRAARSRYLPHVGTKELARAKAKS